MAMKCRCDQLVGSHSEVAPGCLKDFWIFNDLDTKEIEALSAAAMRRKASKGHHMFFQGNETKEMFLIKWGRVRLFKIMADGTEITLDIRKAGDRVQQLWEAYGRTAKYASGSQGDCLIEGTAYFLREPTPIPWGVAVAIRRTTERTTTEPTVQVTQTMVARTTPATAAVRIRAVFSRPFDSSFSVSRILSNENGLLRLRRLTATAFD